MDHSYYLAHDMIVFRGRRFTPTFSGRTRFIHHVSVSSIMLSLVRLTRGVGLLSGSKERLFRGEGQFFHIISRCSVLN